MIKIEELQDHDLEKIVQLLLFYHSESIYKDSTPSPDRIRHVLKNHCQGNQGRVFVAKEGQEIIGCSVGLLTPSLSTLETISYLLAWFVKPEKRKSMVGGRLFYAYKNWSASQGCHWLVAGHMAGSHLANTFMKRDTMVAETTYKWRLNCQN